MGQSCWSSPSGDHWGHLVQKAQHGVVLGHEEIHKGYPDVFLGARGNDRDGLIVDCPDMELYFSM